MLGCTDSQVQVKIVAKQLQRISESNRRSIHVQVGSCKPAGALLISIGRGKGEARIA